MQKDRGAGWVAVQVVLLLGIFFIPGQYLGEPLTPILAIIGLVIGAIGLVLVAIAGRGLGHSFSVFPKPIKSGKFVNSGIYGLVRHPMYAGVILAALGWALFRTSLIALVLVLVLIIFFDRKAAKEEDWLAQQYPDYAEYRKRTRKLIPFLY